MRVLRALAVVVLCPLLACSSAPPSPSEETGTSADEVRVCAGGETVEGIDVSYYQGAVDWDRIRASGRRFAFVRVSDGLGFMDSEFDRNWREAKRAGVIRGAYQYFRAGSDATKQADLVVAKLGRLGPGDLPAVIDVESADGQSSATIVRGVRTWIRRVKEGTGRDPIVYAASGFWDSLVGTDEFSTQKLWVANYGVSCPSVPRTWGRWAFWQYSDSGSVPGVPGGCDVNRFQGSLAQLEALANAEDDAPSTLEPIEVYWARQADGSYDLRALASKNVARVTYLTDGYAIGSATRAAGDNFPASYRYSLEGKGRKLEVRGYDAAGKNVALGVGSIDVTADTAVFIKQLGKGVYEIGLERAPAEVAAIRVEADGYLLTDSETNATASPRNAVRSFFGTLGDRTFAITTLDAKGAERGTITRSFTLR